MIGVSDVLEDKVSFNLYLLNAAAVSQRTLKERIRNQVFLRMGSLFAGTL
jgi:hypothetical protein